MNIEQQKEIAYEILQRLSVVCKEVCIAGGAPRNWYLDRPARDVDFYLFTKSKLDVDSFHSLMSSVGFDDLVPVGGGSSETYAGEKGINAVLETVVDELPVQFIAVEWSFDKIVDTFTVSISKLYLSLLSSGRINNVYTPEFLESVKTKTITAREPKTNGEFEYINKIYNYFPDWNWVHTYDPEEVKQKLIQEKKKEYVPLVWPTIVDFMTTEPVTIQL